MKKSILTCLICVLFYVFTASVGVVYCNPSEQIEFSHNGKFFTYTLASNIKSNSQFDLNYEINKYNRFGSKQERVELLQKLLNIGIEKSVALEYIFPNILKKIDSIGKSINIKPEDAILKVASHSNNVFKITAEKAGLKINKSSLVEKICFAYLNNKPMKFNVPTSTLQPKITKKDFQKFTNLRSDFSTDISSSTSARKHNVKNALSSLNKLEIAPNQIFSFNNSVGKRTIENGYREAKIIVNNEFVDGIGGGVCQVSSTLYNSALLAGLEIIEANKHSKQVNYVKYGFDAMVNFGSSDLKFRNNTSQKLTIITNYSPTTARIRIYGESLNNTSYKLSNEILNSIEPKEEVLIDEKHEHEDKVVYEDEYFFLKRGNRGMEIKSYRETYVNNVLLSKELLRHDKYKVQNAVKIYGSVKRDAIKEHEKSAENLHAWSFKIIPFDSQDKYN